MKQHASMEDFHNNSVVSTHISDVTNLNASLEDDNVSIKVVSAIISIVFMVFSLFAVVALNKTKHTPKTARFLSSGLIVYDVLAVTCFTSRKFMVWNELNIVTQIVGSGFAFLAYITVGVMSLERLVIFYSPNFYLRAITPRRVKTYVSVVWLTMFFMYYFIRFGVCYLIHTDVTLYDVIGKCNRVSFLFYGVFIFGAVVISAACYAKIFLIVKSEKYHTNTEHTLSGTAKFLQNYKSTSLVFVYIMTIIITSVAYAFIFCLGLETVQLRLAVDVVNMFNCMMDPCMYVIWYSECRMEILKMMSVCIPSLLSNIEPMRIKIYQIVTIENVQNIRSNKVHPIQ